MSRPAIPGRLLLAVLLFVCTPLASAEDVVDVLRRSHAAMIDQGAFVTEMTADSGGRKVQTRVEVVWPDRYHMTSSGGGADTEVIILPGTTWMKQGGQWMKLPMDMGQMIQAFQPDAMKQSIDNIANAEELPQDSVDGKAARVIRYDTQATVMGVRSKSTVKAWLDADTLLPLMQEIDGEAMGMRSRTTQRYSYPDGLTIEAPN
jgi:hypothetical protein